jgi:DNA-binding XRE family transcriptional regulator
VLSVPDYKTHLDRLMAERGMANHQLAKAIDEQRQSIWKLRKGVTRMLPHWAKRIAPHLGVDWQELIEGTSAPADARRIRVNASYDAMSEAAKRLYDELGIRLASSGQSDPPPADPPPNPTPPRPKERSPPSHPLPGGRDHERRVSDRREPRNNGAGRRVGD